MNFEEFKKRYIKKMAATGMYTAKELEQDASFNDNMAEIYLALMVYAEFQNEYAKAEVERQRKEDKKWIDSQMVKQKIILPNNGIIQ